MLHRLSDRIKYLVRKEFQNVTSPRAEHELELANEPSFNTFYNAGTLVVICAKGDSAYLQADSWLAAENLMLAAWAKGLGACPIGFAIPALKSEEWRVELNIPEDTAPIEAIIAGFPEGRPRQRTARKSPKILSWRRQ